MPWTAILNEKPSVDSCFQNASENPALDSNFKMIVRNLPWTRILKILMRTLHAQISLHIQSMHKADQLHVHVDENSVDW